MKSAIYVGRVASYQAKCSRCSTVGTPGVPPLCPPRLIGRIAPTRTESINLRGVFTFPIELRVGDAGAGLRFQYSQWSARLVMLLRGHSSGLEYCRSIAQWRSLLGQCGFESKAKPMTQGTRFANVLLIAHAA